MTESTENNEKNVGEDAASGFDMGEGSASAEQDKDNAIDIDHPEHGESGGGEGETAPDAPAHQPAQPPAQS